MNLKIDPTSFASSATDLLATLEPKRLLALRRTLEGAVLGESAPGQSDAVILRSVTVEADSQTLSISAILGKKDPESLIALLATSQGPSGLERLDQAVFRALLSISAKPEARSSKDALPKSSAFRIPTEPLPTSSQDLSAALGTLKGDQAVSVIVDLRNAIVGALTRRNGAAAVPSRVETRAVLAAEADGTLSIDLPIEKLLSLFGASFMALSPAQLQKLDRTLTDALVASSTGS